MKLLIDIPKEKYEWIKTHNLNIDNDSIVGDVVNGIPYEERPQAEWVFRNGVTCVGYYKCSKCGEVERAEKNFCPNCGARMKGGKENG